ncbi:unnamed protein product [Dibothriocephalus latus]|uniref:Uncharacterized protein n=1 Tax=Dibothriocephalus latus TaxID=60516 RepID=A0A3P7LT91_DIBLA|nr:unnamed protein product [Dibothriocephalus latus]
MPKKAKRQKKEKKSKKDKGKQKGVKKQDRTAEVTKRIAVCGNAATVRQVIAQSGKLKTDTDGAVVTMNVENRMNGAEVAAGGNYDGVLCVYDVRKQKSYNFLKERVLSAAKSKSPNAYLMVAAVGLEYRGSAERPLVPNQELKSLASANGASCTELISSNFNEMASGILALFLRTDPNSVRQNSNIPTNVETAGDGGKKKKKDKKEKKGEKEKKPKRKCGRRKKT